MEAFQFLNVDLLFGNSPVESEKTEQKHPNGPFQPTFPCFFICQITDRDILRELDIKYEEKCDV